MKIKCTTGCVYDRLTIDNVDISKINEETKELVLDKIQNYLLTKKITSDEIGDFVSQCLWLISSPDIIDGYKIVENDETCEISFDGHSIEETSKSTINSFIKDYISVFKAQEDSKYTCLVWWFMRDLIGLKYQYTCEECGDSVRSRTIHI